jgi:outer membrane protein assembly factor BamB
LQTTGPASPQMLNAPYVSSGSFIYAVDVQNGREVWRYPAEADSKLLFYATPVLTEDGQLLIGSAGGTHPSSALTLKPVKRIGLTFLRRKRRLGGVTACHE